MKVLKIFIVVIIFANFQSISAQISDIIPEWAFGYDENSNPYKPIVLDGWYNSGSVTLKNGSISIDQECFINVLEYDENIIGNMEPVGQLIQNMLNYYNNKYPSKMKLFWFPPGAYKIEIPLKIPSKTIIKGAGGDGDKPEQTHFHFDFTDNIDVYCITINGKQTGIEDIYFIDDTKVDEVIKNYKGDSNYGYKSTVTFSASAKDCWMRGVESNHTRRFHVNIYGENITVSGCYFHHAIDYSNDHGRGYGVCLSNSSYKCLIENNIFQYLRHSIVIQYIAKVNVIGYNYSREVHGNNGILDWSKYLPDLCFHGRKNYPEGPTHNLCEGNIVRKIQFDDEHKQNGPYNTVFRCWALDYLRVDKVEFSGNNDQFSQNIVAINAKPHGSTWDRINENGFLEYWDDEGGSYDECPFEDASYYHTEKPDFFICNGIDFDWPYVPDVINPAKYRYDRNHGYYQNHPPINEALFAGWDKYYNICCPPSRFFTNGESITEIEKEYKAMRTISAGPYVLNSNNNIVFHAGESIKFLPGFKITNNNNHFIAYTGNICDFTNKSNSDFINLHIENYNNIDSPKYFNDSLGIKEFDKHKQDEGISKNKTYNLTIFPNPGTGLFTIDLKNKYGNKYSLTVFNSNGIIIFRKNNLMKQSYILNLNDKPKGIYFIKINTKNEAITKKIIVF